MLNNAQKNPKEHSYQNSVLVLCIIFDRLVFHYFFQLIFRLVSAGITWDSNEKFVNQTLCTTLKHWSNNHIMNAKNIMDGALFKYL